MLEKKFLMSLLCLVVVLSFSATSAIGANILFIVADPTVASYPNDALIKNFLEGLGHTVTYLDDGVDKPAMGAAAAAADLVYISESCGSGSIHSKINEIEVPMIAGEPWGWDEMGLTHGGGAGTEVTSPDITIVNPGHYLAAGLSGTVTVLTDITGPDGTARFANGIAGSQATVIATAQTGDVIFVYEKEAALAVRPTDGTPQIAADIRVCLGFDYRSHVLFNENAYALIEAAVNYALGFRAPPGVAKEPSPADAATDVPREVVLGWKPGIFAPPTNGHKVFFGENFNDVNNGIGGVTQDTNSYTPAQRLDFGTTYYWRIDEVNGPPDYTVHQGSVWSFTTEPLGYPIENIIATASSSHSADMGPENTINGSGLDANDLHSTEETTMWLSGTEPLGAWIQYEFDKVYKLHQMWVWNSNQVVEPLLGFGLKDVTIEYSTNGTDYTTLGTTHQFAQAPGTPDYAHNTTIDLGGVGAKYVRLTANSNWGGIMPQYGLGEVRLLYIPVQAREPNPADGQTDVSIGTIDKPTDVTLSFRAGREAATHNVYHSADEQAVIDGTAPVTTVTEGSYGPLSLDLGVTHYWRVDEANEAETPATWQGDLWDFTTQEYFIVDDFESYNDLDTTDLASKRIFNVWLDGYQVPTNGSLVGYENPPFCERTIVHGGKQSMPLFYNNAGGAAYSEADLPLSPPQDWTKAGIATLVLYFHGVEGNTGQLYVKLNGSKVVYDGDAADITKPQWQQWNINLAPLGVDLQNVTKLGIGIDGNGATGTLYVEDIRLYGQAPQPEVP